MYNPCIESFKSIALSDNVFTPMGIFLSISYNPISSFAPSVLPENLKSKDVSASKNPFSSH